MWGRQACLSGLGNRGDPKVISQCASRVGWAEPAIHVVWWALAMWAGSLVAHVLHDDGTVLRWSGMNL